MTGTGVGSAGFRGITPRTCGERVGKLGTPGLMAKGALAAGGGYSR